jgi:hypothetical protein
MFLCDNAAGQSANERTFQDQATGELTGRQSKPSNTEQGRARERK